MSGNLFDEMSGAADVSFDDLIEMKAREIIESTEAGKEQIRLEKQKLDKRLENDAFERKKKLEAATQKLQTLLKKPNFMLSKADYLTVKGEN